MSPLTSPSARQPPLGEFSVSSSSSGSGGSSHAMHSSRSQNSSSGEQHQQQHTSSALRPVEIQRAGRSVSAYEEDLAMPDSASSAAPRDVPAHSRSRRNSGFTDAESTGSGILGSSYGAASFAGSLGAETGMSPSPPESQGPTTPGSIVLGGASSAAAAVIASTIGAGGQRSADGQGSSIMELLSDSSAQTGTHPGSNDMDVDKPATTTEPQDKTQQSNSSSLAARSLGASPGIICSGPLTGPLPRSFPNAGSNSLSPPPNDAQRSGASSPASGSGSEISVSSEQQQQRLTLPQRRASMWQDKDKEAAAALQAAAAAQMKLKLDPEEQQKWAQRIENANTSIASDASRLPKSTGRQGIPVPPPKPEEIAATGFWEEDEIFERKQLPAELAPKKGRMMRAIPCLFVSNIQQSLPFYREILGFVNVTKPDAHLANICRNSGGKPSLAPGEIGVQLHLRGPSTGTGALGNSVGSNLYGRRPSSNATSQPAAPAAPPPQSLSIEVENVDDMFSEIYHAAKRTAPTEDDYFPAFPFGQARLESRPTNTAFGTREFRVHDADGNLLVFFQDMTSAASNARASAAAAAGQGAGSKVAQGSGGSSSSGNPNLVRGPVFRNKVRRR